MRTTTTSIHKNGRCRQVIIIHTLHTQYAEDCDPHKRTCACDYPRTKALRYKPFLLRPYRNEYGN